MKIYLVTVDKYNYDEYDSAVVCEKSPKKAKEFCEIFFNKKDVICELLGTANSKQKAGVILSSFNAG